MTYDCMCMRCREISGDLSTELWKAEDTSGWQKMITAFIQAFIQLFINSDKSFYYIKYYCHYFHSQWWNHLCVWIWMCIYCMFFIKEMWMNKKKEKDLTSSFVEMLFTTDSFDFMFNQFMLLSSHRHIYNRSSALKVWASSLHWVS